MEAKEPENEQSHTATEQNDSFDKSAEPNSDCKKPDAAENAKRRRFEIATICIGLATLFAVLIWVSTICHHEKWLEATCTSPKTCAECGATEGETLGHEWKEATCTEPKTCEVCDATEGDALGHSFGEWSENAEIDVVNEVMLNSRKCSVCGKKEQAEGSKLTSFVENGRFIFSPWGINKRFEDKLGVASKCDDDENVLSFAYTDDSELIAMLSFTSMDGQENLGAAYKYDSACNPSPILLINSEYPKLNMADVSTTFVMSCDPSLDYEQAFSVVENLADNITGYSSSTTRNGIEYLLVGHGNITMLRAVVA